MSVLWLLPFLHYLCHDFHLTVIANNGPKVLLQNSAPNYKLSISCYREGHSVPGRAASSLASNTGAHADLKCHFTLWCHVWRGQFTLLKSICSDGIGVPRPGGGSLELLSTFNTKGSLMVLFSPLTRSYVLWERSGWSIWSCTQPLLL